MKKQRVTIYDIAKVLGTTHATVSRALSDNPRISDETKQKVRKAAKEMGYRPNFAARSFGTGKTQMIGMITPDLRNPYYIDFIKAAENECLNNKYRLFTIEYQQDITKEIDCMEEMLEHRCDGVIAHVTRFSKLIKEYKEFWSRRIPLAMPGLPSDLDQVTANTANIDGTTVNHTSGIRKAMNYLADLGHKNIFYIASWPEHMSDYGRFEGLKQGFTENKIQYNPDKCIIHKYSGDEIKDGYDATIQILKQNPEVTAILATNDLMAVGVFRAIHEKGLNIPNDISVIGYDNTWISKNFPISITTIDQQTEYTAKKCVHIILERLEEKNWDTPKIITIEPELIIRESTTRAR